MKQPQEQLENLLAKVQKEGQQEEFIYGVTDRTKRGFFQKVNDFLIDKSSVPLKEKAYFFELLATMIRAGISLHRALKLLVHKTEHQRLRRIVSTIAYELEHGQPLSRTLERFPTVFQESERGAVKSAEAIGNLEQMLFKIGDTLNRKQDLVSRLSAALVYPIAVVCALIVGISVMIVFVVPKMQDIFAGSHLDLPFATRVLLGMSSFLGDFWWVFAILIIFTTIGFHVYTRSPEGQFVWDFKKLRIPLIGKILRKIFVLRFVDTLGLLIESGLPINATLELVANTIGNEVYRVKTYDALAQVQQGVKLSQALMDSPFLFPETVNNMLAIGEQSASLGSISVKISEHYQKEIDHTLKTMTTVLGPLLILVIGVTVAFFALAILSPIFSLTQNIQ